MNKDFKYKNTVGIESTNPKDMPKDHIKFLFDDLKVLIRELQDGN